MLTTWCPVSTMLVLHTVPPHSIGACYEPFSLLHGVGFFQSHLCAVLMQMFYRPPVNGQVHNIRAVADFALKSVEILALAREFDLVKSWNWTVSDSSVLETRGDFDIDAMVVLKMPWPYKQRFTAFRCKGGDFLDERGSVAVVFESCHQV
jgi:hypothetical protein